jgi:hypothetical protein
MPRISVAFLSVAALCGLAGMALGAWMGATEDFTMMPVHAHINLLGWVTLAIMGLFYALPSAGAAARLAWANFILSAGGVVVMSPMLAWFLADQAHHGPVIGPWFPVPEVMLGLGLALFLVNVLRTGAKPAL